MFRVIKESEYVDERQHCFLIQTFGQQSHYLSVETRQVTATYIYVRVKLNYKNAVGDAPVAIPRRQKRWQIFFLIFYEKCIWVKEGTLRKIGSGTYVK